jgi:DNA polymerase I
MRLSEFDDNRTEKEELKLITLEYRVKKKGVSGCEPIVTLYCRDSSGNRRIVEVENYYPYFYARNDEVREKKESLKNDHKVRKIEYDCYESLKGVSVTRIYTKEPYHVAEMRDVFSETWEADIFFTNRFLIDSGIKVNFEIPKGKDTVSPNEIYPVENGMSVSPRVVFVDIEVLSGGEMPETTEARKPINAITAYDSYDQEYTTWVLKSEEWDEEPDFPERVFEFDDERSLLEDFNNWMGRREIDILSGWNSSQNNIGDGFDYPYLLNRCENLNVYSTDKWSPEGKAFCGEYGEAKVTGVELIDLMQAYKKTQVHDLESYSLDFVANKELGVGKEEIEGLDEGYFYEPEKFIDYNIRDVEALVEINEEAGVIQLYESLREVTGAKFGDCHNNIDMLDVFFLRKANEQDMALPTSVKPDTDWYHGAFVYKPEPGKYKNILYPDLASLYPSLLKTLNISPDTIIGFGEDLEKSEYDEDDCFVTYVDRREVAKAEGNTDEYKNDNYKAIYNPSTKTATWTNDPQFDKLYYLKPEKREGFISGTIDELIDLKYQYTGKRYEAVKRVTNSCFTPDTEVLTPDGIKNITNIEVGDMVYSWNKETGQMEKKEVIDTIEKPEYDGELIHIQNNNIDLKVTPDHRMLVKRPYYNDDWETTNAGDLNDYTHYETPNRWNFNHSNDIDQIDLANFVSNDFKVSESKITYGNAHNDFDRFIDGNTFIEILGWYITEGCVYKSDYSEPRGDSLQIAQCKDVNEDTYNRIVNCMEKCVDYVSTSDKSIEICGSLYVDILSRLCGKGSENKTIPEIVFQKASKSQKELLLEVLMLGDGDSCDVPRRYSTKSKQLRDDVIRLLWELGYKPSYNYDSGVWRIFYTEDDSGKKSKQSFRMHRDSNREKAENGVYCIQVEDNHTLVAGRNGKFTNIPNCYGVLGDSSSYNKGFRLFDWRLAETVTLAGRKVLQFTGEKYVESMKNQGYEDSKLVYGDSDSVLTSIPSAETTTEALIAGKKASEYTKEQYDIFMEDEFNADEHLMDVEIESYASAIFFSRKSNDLDNAEEAAKKRYAQIIEWDEDEGFFGYKANPKPKLKGFDAIRSDTSQITKEVQEEVLRIILEVDEPKDEVYEYLEDKIDEIKSGEHLEKLGIPESINEELSYYGDDNRRCVPKIRGAKYATQNFEGVNIEKGGAPKTYRINSISQDYPQVYEAETPEDGDKVDAVSVENVSDLPVEDIEFDYDTMLDKTLKSSLEPILRTMGWSWNDVVTDGRQQGLEAFA